MCEIEGDFILETSWNYDEYGNDLIQLQQSNKEYSKDGNCHLN